MILKKCHCEFCSMLRIIVLLKCPPSAKNLGCLLKQIFSYNLSVKLTIHVLSEHVEPNNSLCTKCSLHMNFKRMFYCYMPWYRFSTFVMNLSCISKHLEWWFIRENYFIPIFSLVSLCSNNTKIHSLWSKKRNWTRNTNSIVKIGRASCRERV